MDVLKNARRLDRESHCREGAEMNEGKFCVEPKSPVIQIAMTEAQWVTVFDAVGLYKWDRIVDLLNKEGLTERGKITGTNMGKSRP